MLRMASPAGELAADFVQGLKRINEEERQAMLACTAREQTRKTHRRYAENAEETTAPGLNEVLLTFAPALDGATGDIYFFLSVVVVFWVVVVCVSGAGAEPSAFAGAGVVCVVSVLLVVEFSVELVAGGGFTTVVGGGVC
jgi:hypothetical protein